MHPPSLGNVLCTNLSCKVVPSKRYHHRCAANELFPQERGKNEDPISGNTRRVKASSQMPHMSKHGAAKKRSTTEGDEKNEKKLAVNVIHPDTTLITSLESEEKTATSTALDRSNKRNTSQPHASCAQLHPHVHNPRTSNPMITNTCPKLKHTSKRHTCTLRQEDVRARHIEAQTAEEARTDLFKLHFRQHTQRC